MEIDPATNGNTDAVMAESTLTITPSPPVPASRLSQLTESLKLEHQLLRVPFEHYKKTIHSNHHSLEKEISSVVSSVGDLADNNWSKDVSVRFAITFGSHLILDIAFDLVVDINIFREAKKVVDALKRREVASALAWCADNKTRLKKVRYSWYELTTTNKQNPLCSKAPWGATHMNELQHVLATMASKSTTECTKYKVLFELQQQRDVLVHQFKQEFCKLYGMTMEPLLNIYLQAGLSRLASTAKKHYSKLVCYISKELMDTENPPQVFLNGYFYITKALEEMADKNKGEVKCPRRELVCKYTDLVKAYIS
ncbi:hypothetical protein Bca52824_007699 [Brassica carinata]|uniref:CTLH domain-containing protein n=1 Tax=Brassica carinata TaxID=52824 RepID=A0A8X7W8D3_BRACI|nr:hypothetical protein Bca52824_007699 [Brassica carinata]